MRNGGIIRASSFALAAAAMLVAGCSGGGGGGGEKADSDVIVGIISGPVSESGEQATFTVRLRGKPSRDVVIPISSLDIGEGTVSPASLTFTKSDWDAPQEVLVTGVDDFEKDGNAAFTIALGPIESDDGGYDELDPDDILVTNLDDETAAVRFTPVSGPTTELGTEATFSVYLQSQPTSDVLLIFGTSALDEGTTGGLQTATFTPDNWDSPQVVTVTGVDDEEADGAQNYAILFQSAFSDDPAYAFLPVDAVPITNLDDDTAGFLVSQTNGVTSERLDQVTFSVRLLSRPSATVSMTWVISDTGEASYSDSTSANKTIQFTVNNWQTPQEITVRGDNDTLADGDQLYTVSVTSVTSSDTSYVAATRPVVHLVNVDDDIAGFIVTPPTGPTSESGDSATFTIALRGAATSPVTVDLSTTNSKEATVSPANLTLTTTPKTVTVKGAVDFRQDGHKPFAVTFAPVVSLDPAYDGRQIANVGLTNIDDGPIRRLLVHDDANGSEADDAADEAGYTVLQTSDFASFDNLFDTEDLYLVIMELTTALLPAATESRLSAWASSGGRLILSHWDLASHAGLQSALEVTATPFPSNNRFFLPSNDAQVNLFMTPSPFPAPLLGNVLAGDTGNELMVTTTGGQIAVRFDDADPLFGDGAVAITRQGAVIVNGFSPDDIGPVDVDDLGVGDGIPDLRELYINEIAAVASGGGLQAQSRFDNNTPMPIPAMSESVLNVPESRIVASVKVLLYITHAFDADVEISLEGPDGTLVDLSIANGGSLDDYGSACSPDASRTTFDDAAGTAITSASPPYVGSFQPEEPLSAFNGKDTNGDWTLHVFDNFPSLDDGTLNCWSLEFEYQ